MASEVSAPFASEPKFSRYRSVRQMSDEAGIHPPSTTEPSCQDSIKRSISRYRAKRPTRTHAAANAYPDPPVDHSLSQQDNLGLMPKNDGQRNERLSRAQDSKDDRRGPLEEVNTCRFDSKKGSGRQRSQKQGKSSISKENTHRNLPAREDSCQRHWDDAQHLELAKSPIKPGESEKKGSSDRKDPLREENISASHFKDEGCGRKQTSRGMGIMTGLERNILQNDVDELGSRGDLLRFDAPVSAVNAGDRTVLVKCNKSSIFLPITPFSTAVDLVRSAGNALSVHIDEKSVVLLESFKQLGLERPLRKYERIRDVLNSWDTDAQNTLIIVPSPTGGNDNDLDAKHVSRENSGDTTVCLYYSQKPGKWDKRWITLRTDGQVLLAKTEDSETAKICHLSDFDIYVPTPRQAAKKIKPPRKICFAVKSQHKSSMFLSTANFVHFFSTGDRKLAAAWYKAVQGWRSWYLVHVMGEGQKSPQKLESVVPKNGTRQALTNSFSHHPQRRERSPLRASTHLTGSSTPVLPQNDSQRISNSVQSSLSSSFPSVDLIGTKTLLKRNKPIRNRGAPPLSFPEGLDMSTSIRPSRGTSLKAKSSTLGNERNSFATTGLLDRTYSRREKAQHNGEVVSLPNSEPFAIESSNTLPSNPSSQAPTEKAERLTPGHQKVLPSQNAKIDGLTRMSSRRERPKPLVDLTPKYQAPPQHCRKGRGIALEQMPPGGLVDIATTPEVAIQVPPAIAWQKSDPISGEGSRPQRTKTMHSPSSHVLRPSGTAAQSYESGVNFKFNEGLLGQVNKGGSGGGTSMIGRRMMTGDGRTQAPMLDLSETSKYAPGSLLAGAEKRTR